MKRNSKYSTGPGLLSLLLGFVLIGSSFEPGLRAGIAQTSQSKEREQPKVSSFIKKELLPRLDPSLANARRDLFRPSSIAPEVSHSGEAVAANQNEIKNLYSGEIEAESILEALNIVYLGLVSSGKKALALVMLDGQAVTLSEGEEVIPGVRLVKISSEEIIFKDSQGNSRKITVKENSDEKN